ncbi:MAG: DUF4340 domain-containing protein [Ruminococcus sp.]|nr:DUF4340 domain-containing protein [Ruminococcus sp.]
MRKKTLGIVGGLVLVVALGGVTAALLATDSSDDDTSVDVAEESSTEEITLIEQETYNVTSIDVTNANDSYEVVRVTEGDDETNANFTIAGWEDLTYISTLYTLPNNTASMTANQIVEEECTDLEKFGLDDDTAAHVTLHFEDGTSYSFRVGNTASGDSYTYFAEEDDDIVYLVSSSYLSNFQNAAVDFVSTTILEEPDEDDYPTVNYLTVERSDLDYIFELDYDETADDEDYTGGTVATHVMTSPVPAYLSPDRSTDYVTGMFGLIAESVAVPVPTDEEMEEYGLADPYGVVTMDCNDGNTYVLLFSEPVTETDEETAATSTYYYAYLEGVDVIYRVTGDDMIWATVEPTDVASKLVLATYVWNVGTLNVTITDNDTFTFSAEGTDDEDTVVTLNGKTTDTERYRQFYAFLLNTTAETIDFTSEPEGDPLAEIYVETQDSSFSRDLVFYALDDYTCLITVNGQAAYTCRKSYLTTLQSNMEKYNNTDEDFSSNWS